MVFYMQFISSNRKLVFLFKKKNRKKGLKETKENHHSNEQNIIHLLIMSRVNKSKVFNKAVSNRYRPILPPSRIGHPHIVWS